MNEKSIFRKIAVERLSSPENLDQVMYVVPARNWIALICLFAFVLAAVAWACLGEIARLVEGEGMLLPGISGASESVVAFLDAEDGSNVRTGMEAHITLDIGKDATLVGKVVSVSTVDETTLTLDGRSITEESLPGWKAGSGDIVAVIELDAGEIQKVAQVFPTFESQTIDYSSGLPCEIQITIESYHPIQLILSD